MGILLFMKTTIRAAIAALFTSFGTLSANASNDTPVSAPPEVIRKCIIPEIATDSAQADVVDVEDGRGPAEPFTLEVDVTARSQYVGDENGGIFYDGPVIQTDIRLSHESGLYLGVWLSSGFDTEWPSTDWSDEVDVYVGYTKEVGGFEIDASIFWCDDTPVGRSPINDVLIAGLTVTAPAVIETENFNLRPNAFITGYWTFGDTDFEGGVIGGIGLVAAYAPTEKLSIDASAHVIHDDGAYGNDSGALLRATLAVTWAINDTLSFKPLEMTVFTPLSVVDERKTECVLGVGFTLTF
jgi:hypothetical protein